MTWGRRLGIRDRVVLAIGGSALLAILVAGAGLALFNGLTLKHRARQVMEPYAHLVSVGTETAVAFEDPERAEEVLATLRANPQILAAEIILKNGRVLARYSHETAEARTPSDPLRIDGLDLTRNRASLVETLPDGAQLHLVMGLQQFNRQTRDALLLLAAGILILLAGMAIGLGAVLQRTIIGPITALAATVERVHTEADYRRGAPDDGSDELAQLGRSFNAMLAAIKKREDELRLVTLSQQAILDNAAYGIISVGPDGTVTRFNPAAEKLLGYSAEEIVGKQTPLRWHDPQEVTRRAEELSVQLGEEIPPGFAVFSACARRDMKEDHEWTFIRKDGVRFPAQVSITALRSVDGQVTGFVGLTQDLTERRRAEEDARTRNLVLEHRVKERTAQLQASNLELEAFCYSVSHDLRAPLRHIDGYVDMMISRCRPSLTDNGVHYLDTISASARQMGELIDDLLELSRTGRAEMRQGPVDMNRALREALASTWSPQSERAIEWHIGTLPWVRGDFALLRQVWVNLLSNAVKYSATKDHPKIEVEAVETGDEIIFSVSDNGVGFDMRYAGKLFGAFQRLHAPEEFEGTGIGLAIVHRIITRHGGRVWAAATVGEGSKFSFTLPRNPEVSSST